MFGKIMDLNMLVILGGVERTEDEFRHLLERAGFCLTRIVPTEVEVSVIEGVKALMNHWKPVRRGGAPAMTHSPGFRLAVTTLRPS